MFEYSMIVSFGSVPVRGWVSPMDDVLYSNGASGGSDGYILPQKSAS
jgi:hypothetical protein